MWQHFSVRQVALTPMGSVPSNKEMTAGLYCGLLIFIMYHIAALVSIE